MKLSILGMYQYDNTIFDKLTFPTGIDWDTAVQQILLDNAELSVVYPSIPVMKEVIHLWSKTMQWTWKKRYEVTQLKYNPIENTDRYFDRYEDGVNTAHTVTTSEHTGSENLTTHGTDTSVGSEDGTENRDGTTDNWVHAFDDGRTDSTGDERSERITRSGNTHGEVASESTNDRTTKNDNSGSSDDRRTHSYHFSEHTHGNIGVTTNQQMLRDEWDIANLNLYESISKDFRDRFCILVY